MEFEVENAYAIILAGGSSSRMGESSNDKILLPLARKPVIAHSINAFLESEVVSGIVLVYRDDEQRLAIEKLIQPTKRSLVWAKGGIERQDSVWSGLKALPKETEIVLIHDGARPLVTANAIRKTALAASKHGAASLARPVTDTLKKAGSSSIPETYSLETVDRSTLWAMETPQAFRYSLIKDAYQKVIESGIMITDDLAAVESTDQPIQFIENERPNVKLTTPLDISYLEFVLQS